MPFDTIILDVQHAGKPHNPFDRGAKSNDNYEADLALQYAICTRERFLSVGYKTFLLCHGRYGERHEWVNQYCNPYTSLYLACHLNAGGGKYPLVEYYYDAGEQTRKIAKFIANKFTEKLTPVREDPAYPYFSPAQVWEIPYHERGWVCLAGTRMPALLLEPLFIDNPAHLAVAKKPLGIAWAIFDAVEGANQA